MSNPTETPSEPDAYLCAFPGCAHEATGFLPSGYVACDSHAIRVGVRPIPFQREAGDQS